MNEKKVGIVTLFYKNYNFGGLLQAYALQKTIEKLGYDVKQICIDRDTMDVYKPKYSTFSSIIKHFVLRSLKNKWKDIKVGGFKNKRTKSIPLFESFIDQIPHTDVYTAKNLINANNDFDIFVCGSDQIWNPLYSCEGYFLSFVDDRKIKFSYAASIGLESLEKNYIDKVKKYTENYSHISVREHQAKKVLQEFLDKDIEVVLDPTLMLERNEWEELIKDIKPYNFKYVLVYFLGINTEFHKIVREYANARGLKIICLPTRPDNANFGDYNLYEVGPKEFLSLINNSEYIFTDSFHASVFSIIFEKQFRTFSRELLGHTGTMNSRLITLLEVTKLRNIIIDGNVKIDDLDNKINYEGVNERIFIEQKNSLTFLKKSLNKEN